VLCHAPIFCYVLLLVVTVPNKEQSTTPVAMIFIFVVLALVLALVLVAVTIAVTICCLRKIMKIWVSFIESC